MAEAAARGDARQLVVRALARVRSQQVNLPQALEQAGIDRLSGVDQRLARELANGLARRFHGLRALLAGFLKKPLRKADGDIELLLMLGLYQLAALRLPAYAAVNETVQVARAIGKPWAVGLVNGVLRTAQRQDLATALTRQDRCADWLVVQWRRDWPADWRQIQRGSLQRPPMHLRVNASKMTRDDYLMRLRQAGLAARPLAPAPQGLVLEQPCDVSMLPGFEQGWVSVQDGAAQLAAHLLEPVAGDRVLDACAAPGGKGSHLLELAAGQLRLTAVDLYPDRLQRMEEGLRRLGLAAELCADDLLRPQGDWMRRSYRRILLDAPCSATGVLRRHPDIQLLRRPEDIASLAATQLGMLGRLWPLLERGGRLLYCTCSSLREENDEVIEAFVRQMGDEVRVRPIAASWGRASTCGRQILPGEDDLDGFYYACLEK